MKTIHQTIADRMARLILAECGTIWGEATMCTTWAESVLRKLGIGNYGTHKYIPQEELDNRLGETPGAGVFGFYSFSDQSYLLLLCDGRLAVWDQAKDEVRHA